MFLRKSNVCLYVSVINSNVFVQKRFSVKLLNIGFPNVLSQKICLLIIANIRMYVNDFCSRDLPEIQRNYSIP